MPSASLKDVRWIEVLDLAEEFAPRRWKRRAATAFIIGLVVVPSLTMPAFRWYISERTESITDRLVEVVLPTPPSTKPLGGNDDHDRSRERDGRQRDRGGEGNGDAARK